LIFYPSWIQCCGSGSGIRCFFDPGIRDKHPGSEILPGSRIQGSKKRRHPRSGSATRLVVSLASLQGCKIYSSYMKSQKLTVHRCLEIFHETGNVSIPLALNMTLSYRILSPNISVA
jgi:hypothetical protein